MKENVQLDFDKYSETIKNAYQRFYLKRLMLCGIALTTLLMTLVLLPSLLLKVLVGALFGPALILLLVRDVQRYRQQESYLAEKLQYWVEGIETLAHNPADFRLYEDPNNYYLKGTGDPQRFSKQGSRTLPSAERGLSLILAANSDIFAADPLLVQYCDTTEIKYLNLGEMNEKLLRQMKITRLKNKVLPPLFIGGVLLLLYFYLF